MAESVNFNMSTGGTITSAVITSDGVGGNTVNYGYMAVINGVEFGITDISIVNSLKQYIPLLACHSNDLEGLKKALKAPFQGQASSSE